MQALSNGGDGGTQEDIVSVKAEAGNGPVDDYLALPSFERPEACNMAEVLLLATNVKILRGCHKAFYGVLGLVAYNELCRGKSKREDDQDKSMQVFFLQSIERLKFGQNPFARRALAEVDAIREPLALYLKVPVLPFCAFMPSVQSIDENRLLVKCCQPRKIASLRSNAKLLLAKYNKVPWQELLDKVLVNGGPPSGKSWNDVFKSYYEHYCEHFKIPQGGFDDAVLADVLFGHFAKTAFGEEPLNVIAGATEVAGTGRKQQRAEERLSKSGGQDSEKFLASMHDMVLASKASTAHMQKKMEWEVINRRVTALKDLVQLSKGTPEEANYKQQLIEALQQQASGSLTARVDSESSSYRSSNIELCEPPLNTFVPLVSSEQVMQRSSPRAGSPPLTDDEYEAVAEEDEEENEPCKKKRRSDGKIVNSFEKPKRGPGRPPKVNQQLLALQRAKAELNGEQ
jgi:hypothetical protein